MRQRTYSLILSSTVVTSRTSFHRHEGVEQPRMTPHLLPQQPLITDDLGAVAVQIAGDHDGTRTIHDHTVPGR